MNSKPIWPAAVIVAAIALEAASLINVPSEQQLAEATAASLRDAQRQAEQEARKGRSMQQIAQSDCKRMHGEHAQLVQLSDGQDYACRRRQA